MDTTTLLISAVIFTVLGFLLSQIIHLFQEAKAPDPESKPPIGQELPTSILDLGRLWEDSRDGSLMVELEGKIFPESWGLSENQRGILEKAYTKLGDWLGFAPASAAAGEAKPANDLAAGESPLPAAPLRAEANLDLVSEVLTGRRGAVVFHPAARNSLAPESIAQQVDRVLQEILLGSSMNGRIIHLIDGPDQGLRVLVDSAQYEGIEEVPDENVRVLLRGAVEEWRRRALHL